MTGSGEEILCFSECSSGPAAADQESTARGGVLMDPASGPLADEVVSISQSRRTSKGAPEEPMELLYKERINVAGAAAMPRSCAAVRGRTMYHPRPRTSQDARRGSAMC